MKKIKITKEDTGFQNGKIRIQAIDGGEITVRQYSGGAMGIRLMQVRWICMLHQKGL